MEDCKKIVDLTFEDVNLRIEYLINSLLSYNNDVVEDSIKKYNDIYNNNQKNRYSNNIKQLINEIISLERKHFNDTTNSEVEKFLNTPIKIIPSINLYNIKSI